MAKKNEGSHPLIHPKYFPMDMARISILPTGLKYRTKKCYVDQNKKHGPIKGGAIIVANHISFEDPLFINNLFWYRRFYFLAGEELMDKQPGGTMLKGAGCIRIDRNISDINAVRLTVQKLKEGHLLAMFPQGGIKRGEEVGEIKGGAILMALQAKVPIIPVYTERPTKWYKRRKAVIGEPIMCSDYCTRKFPSVSDMNQLSQLLLERMKECEDVYHTTFGYDIRA